MEILSGVISLLLGYLLMRCDSLERRIDKVETLFKEAPKRSTDKRIGWFCRKR